VKHFVRTAIAVATIAVAAGLAAPAAAGASDIYPPSGSCTVSPATAVAERAVTFECMPETFSSGERVTVTVTGAGGGATQIGMLRMAVTTASGTARAEADGSLSEVSITLPADAAGIYNIAAISRTSAGGTAALNVSGGSGGLSTTGIDGATLVGLLIGGGVLVVSGGVLAVVAMRRRSRRD